MSAETAESDLLGHEAPDTPAPLRDVFDRLRRASREGGPSSCHERRGHLERLGGVIRARTADITEAIRADFGHRSKHETLLAEVHLTLAHLRFVRRNLGRWMRPRRCAVSLPFLPARARIHHQPLGVVGIISPWNYPFQLSMLPFIEALAAGNRVLLKPSEIAPRTAEVLRQIVETTFEPFLAAVVTGGPEVGAAFCRLPLDHLFFTGSTAVGRSVLAAAARNLTPVTLELGGKCPAILGEGSPLAGFARRVVAGKLFNAGQTCLAPDYVLAPADRIDPLVRCLEEAIARFYPALARNPDYTSIIDERHYQRLKGWIEDARRKGAAVVEVNPAAEEDLAAQRKIAPTLILGARDDMLVMQEEIFGPLLPIRPYDRLESALEYLASRPRPLALYYFGRDRRRIRQVLERTCSGGVCIHDTIVHAAQHALPLGGVGESGMGAYHGRKGFETFSHARSVFYQSRLSLSHLVRPPYGRFADRLLSRLVGRSDRGP